MNWADLEGILTDTGALVIIALVVLVAATRSNRSRAEAAPNHPDPDPDGQPSAVVEPSTSWAGPAGAGSRPPQPPLPGGPA